MSKSFKKNVDKDKAKHPKKNKLKPQNQRVKKFKEAEFDEEYNWN